jgi:large subunit ribosomal protein L4e
MGRFCIWSQAAVEALDTIYGEVEGGKKIPLALMTNADLARIINSDEIQSVVTPAKRGNKTYLRKKNPLTSVKALEKLDPYAAAARKAAAKAEEARAANKEAIMAAKRAVAKNKKQYREQGKLFFEAASKQGDVCSAGFKAN